MIYGKNAILHDLVLSLASSIVKRFRGLRNSPFPSFSAFQYLINAFPEISLQSDHASLRTSSWAQGLGLGEGGMTDSSRFFPSPTPSPQQTQSSSPRLDHAVSLCRHLCLLSNLAKHLSIFSLPSVALNPAGGLHSLFYKNV